MFWITVSLHSPGSYNLCRGPVSPCLFLLFSAQVTDVCRYVWEGEELSTKTHLPAVYQFVSFTLPFLSCLLPSLPSLKKKKPTQIFLLVIYDYLQDHSQVRSAHASIRQAEWEGKGTRCPHRRQETGFSTVIFSYFQVFGICKYITFSKIHK